MDNIIRMMQYLESPVQTRPGETTPDTPQPFALKTSEQIERERQKERSKANLPKNAFLRNLYLGIKEAGADLAGIAARAIGEPGSADIINRDINDWESVAQEMDKTSAAPEWLTKGLRGATRSTSGMVPVAMTTGPWGAIAYGTATRGNQAITEAQDAGLEGAGKYSYVATAAALEGGITALFQYFGKGGLEAAAATKEVVWKGIRKAVKDYARVSLEELPEEVTIEILDNINQRLHKVNPKGLSPSAVLSKEFGTELWETVRDTTAQTLISTLMGAGGRQVINKVSGAGQPDANAQPQPAQADINVQQPVTPPQPGVTLQPAEGAAPRVNQLEANRIMSKDFFPTDEEIASWVQNNPYLAQELVAGGTSRKNFATMGLSGFSLDKRQQFLDKVQQLLQGQGTPPVDQTTPPAPVNTPGTTPDVTGETPDTTVTAGTTPTDTTVPPGDTPPVTTTTPDPTTPEPTAMPIGDKPAAQMSADEVRSELESLLGWIQSNPGVDPEQRQRAEARLQEIGGALSKLEATDTQTPPAAPQTEQEKYTAELNALSWTDLRTLAKNNGIKIKGSKTSLIEALVKNKFSGVVPDTITTNPTDTTTTQPDTTTTPDEVTPPVPKKSKGKIVKTVTPESQTPTPTTPTPTESTTPAVPTSLSEEERAALTRERDELVRRMSKKQMLEPDSLKDEDLGMIERINEIEAILSGKTPSTTTAPPPNEPTPPKSNSTKLTERQMQIRQEMEGLSNTIKILKQKIKKYRTIVDSPRATYAQQSEAELKLEDLELELEEAQDDFDMAKEAFNQESKPAEPAGVKKKSAAPAKNETRIGDPKTVTYRKDGNHYTKTKIDVGNNHTVEGLAFGEFSEPSPAKPTDKRWSVIRDDGVDKKGNKKTTVLATMLTQEEAIALAKSKEAESSKTSAAQQAKQEADAAKKNDNPGLLPVVGQTRSQPRPKGVKVPFGHPDPDIEKQLTDARGIKSPKFKDRVRDGVMLAWRKMTRPFEFLPNTQVFTTAKEILRLLKSIPEAVSDDVTRTISAILDPMSVEQAQLFERYLVMKNLQSEVAKGGPMRFGFEDKAQVDAYADQLQKFVDANPEVKKAIETRQKIVEELVAELKKYGILPEDADAEWYYHQQVLDFVDAGRIRGGSTLQETKRSAQRKRVRGVEKLESKYNYNTSYIESEFTWMTELRFELEKKKFRQKMKDRYDIKDKLKKEAKEKNYENLVGGKAKVQEINNLLKQIHDLTKNNKPVPKKLIEDLDKLDPTNKYRRIIGRNIAKLKEAIGNGSVDFSKNPKAKRLLSKSPKDIQAALDMMSNDFFDALSWILETNPKTAAGGAAAKILKAIHARNKLYREKLGDKFLTWEKLAEQTPGYGLWQPKPGNVFFQATTIPERIAEMLMTDQIQEANISKAMLNVVTAIGGPNDQWVLPQELVDQLESMGNKRQPGRIEVIAQEVIRKWKVWTLSMPKRIVGYNIRNITGDLDPILASAPKALTYLKQSVTELLDYHGGTLAISDNLQKARDLGVITSSMSAVEIEDLKGLKELARLIESNDDVVKNFFAQAGEKVGGAVDAYFQGAKNWSSFRENLLRYSAFLYYQNELKGGNLQNFGASTKEDIKTLQREMGLDTAAAKLARDLMGDYQNLTVFGDWLRKHAIPFWAWNEVNMTRYPKIIQNAYGQHAGKGVRATAVLGTATALRAGALYAAMQVWNNLFFGDVEDELTDDEQASPHLILWRNPDGTGQIMRNTGALGDLMEWFGVQDFISMAGQTVRGQVSVTDLATQMMKSPINKLVGGIRPDAKAAVEIFTGQSFYPDVFNPRTQARDEGVAAIFGVQDEWMELEGRLRRDGTRARSHYLQRWIGVTDPKRNALNSTYDLMEKFLRKEGREVPAFRGVSQFKPIREAAMNQDYDAFLEARRKYLSQGKTDKQFAASLKNLDPVSNKLTGGMERKFQEFLTPQQRMKVDIARAYSRELYERLYLWWMKAKKEETDG